MGKIDMSTYIQTHYYDEADEIGWSVWDVMPEWVSKIGYEDERWHPCDLLPDVWVSTHGRFYDTLKQRLLKPTWGDSEGHLAVKICRNGKRYQQYAHREVAKAFIPNHKGGNLVRHLDGDPSYNVVWNLAWGDTRDNTMDAIFQGKTYKASPEVKDRALDSIRKPVRVTDLKTGEVTCYRSLNDAIRATGAQQSNAWKVIHGEREQTIGLRFEYISKEEFNEWSNQ